MSEMQKQSGGICRENDDKVGKKKTEKSICWHMVKGWRRGITLHED